MNKVINRAFINDSTKTNENNIVQQISSDKTLSLDFDYETQTFTLINQVVAEDETVSNQLKMIQPTLGDTEFTVSDTPLPSAWTEYLNMDAETQSLAFSKFVRLDDVYAFSDPEYTAEGQGQGRVVVV